MAKVKIICPTCGKQGDIEISPETLKPVSRGLLAINILSKTICQHSFIAYIDRNLHVRNYFVADFHIEIPELLIEDKEKFKEFKIPRNDIVDIDLIKLNMTATLLTYILKSIISKQKIVLISNYEFLFDHIKNFFKYITRNTFDTDIKIMTESDYNKNKKQLKDCMVFNGNDIIRNEKEIINPKKLNVEKHIINKFLTENDLGYSYISLKNEIQKAYELSKSIVDFVKKKSNNNERVNILQAKANLEHKYMIKISPVYLEFINDIVRYYFGIIVPSALQNFLDSF